MAVTCVADALQDAGLSSEQLRGKRVGVILGNSMGIPLTVRGACKPAAFCVMPRGSPQFVESGRECQERSE